MDGVARKSLLSVWTTLILVGYATVLCGAAHSDTPAPMNEFGGWVITPASTYSPHLWGIRAAISNGSFAGASVGGSDNILLDRVILEFCPNPIDCSTFGLIQDGMGLANGRNGLDNCGPKQYIHEFVEWKPVTPFHDFACRWYGRTDPGTTEHFTVGKTEYQTDCNGCYDARINGSELAIPGEVQLGTTYGPAYAATDGMASAEGRRRQFVKLPDLLFWEYAGLGLVELALVQRMRGTVFLATTRTA